MSLRYLVAALTLSLVFVASAQQAGGDTRPLEIREIKVDAQVLTPEYQVKRSQQNARVKNWCQVSADYETKADWLDEAEFVYYVLLKNTKNPKGPPQTLLKGAVTYINIEKGARHRSDMFIHPNTLARFGEVQAVAVMVNIQGRMVALDGKPVSKQRWWEQMTPVDNLLLPRSETPFAVLSFDDYAPVRRATR